MKKILVPTDFSTNSVNALRYAIQIANQFGSTIMLLNTYVIHSTTGSFISIRQFIEKDAEESMSKILDEVRHELRNGASIKYEILEGNPTSLIPKVAKKYDFVVMGTQGATGLLDTFIGSTASGVIQESQKPVLIIPNEIPFKPFKKVVLAVDNSQIALLKSVRNLLDLVKTFEAHLHVFHLEKGADDYGIDPLAEELFNQVEWSFHYEVSKSDVNKSINEFVQEKQADMLCMIKRKRGFWENLFHVSATKKEVFDSPVPVLILQEN